MDEQYPAVEGSCKWIDESNEFRKWKDAYASLSGQSTRESSRQSPALLWVHANPGAGKTVLASYVLNQLQDLNLECSSHYFHIGGKSSQSLGYFLRSLAFQMATTNAAIRDKLVSLLEESLILDPDDCRSIWSKLFLKGIFQVC